MSKNQQAVYSHKIMYSKVVRICKKVVSSILLTLKSLTRDHSLLISLLVMVV